MVPGLNPQTAQAAGVPSSFWLHPVSGCFLFRVSSRWFRPAFGYPAAHAEPAAPAMSLVTNSTDKKALRAQMRARRRALSAAERQAAARRFADRIWPQLQAPQYRHIAVYLAFDGELDLRPLVERLWAAGKAVYLPVLSRWSARRLWFRRYGPHQPLKPNRYGIPEPISGSVLASRQLDVVLLPLTAFDQAGTRLGMGGGFYDCTFAYRRASLASRPRLIGVGYRWQEVQQLVREPHDLPVQAIVTD